MRRLFSVLLFLLPLAAVAGPGDTTWVQAHYNKQLTWFNDYDTAVVFPNGATAYRNIYMHFTLGKYACPGYNPNNPGEPPAGSGWCGDWDYTVQTFLMTPAGDTVELGRFITPYANHNAPRTPLNWKGEYVFDVTDYYPLLKNGATIRVHYSGYSGGFTANIRFAFIEGTRARNVTGITPLWRGSYSYGHGTPIDTRIAAMNYSVPSGTQSSELKFNITGHGNDDAQCSEFCSKNYTVLQGGNTIATRAIWRADCGKNWLYPQSGTWVYDRGNWCPGDKVATHSYTMPASGASTVDVNFDPHTSTASQQGRSHASYIVCGSLIHYGQFNKTVDAGVTDIVSPSTKDVFFRQNPNCGKPIVRVQNNGSATLTQIAFEYGLQGTASPQQYSWTGSLAPLEILDIELPAFAALATAQGTNNGFFARVTGANGTTDGDSYNNEARSTFNAVPEWPASFRINLTTGAFTNGGNNTSWKILNDAGAVVRERPGGIDNITFRDTLINLPQGCYRLVVEDELCDGLGPNYYGSQVGSGAIEVFRYGTTIPLPITLPGYFGRNFGCGFTQHFYVINPAGVTEVLSGNATLSVSPNPASHSLLVMLDGLDKTKGMLTAVDALGRVVYSAAVSEKQTVLDVSRWPAGMYTLTFLDANGRGKLNAGVVVAH